MMVALERTEERWGGFCWEELRKCWTIAVLFLAIASLILALLISSLYFFCNNSV